MVRQGGVLAKTGPGKSELPLHAYQRRVLMQVFGGAVVASGLPLGARAAARAIRKGGEGVLDVAIIGAGLAGLTAARDPHRAGCESFAMLEARNRVGGHTYNHDLGNGIISEGGGEWIGPGQTAIADLARELEVGTFDSFYAGKTVYLAGDARVTQDVGEGGLASIPRL